MGQGGDDLDRVIPADAGIRDGLTVFQFFFFAFNERLVAFDKIGLDHDAHDVVASVADLLADAVNDIDLLFVLLMAVGVAGINHDRWRKTGCFQRFADFGYALDIVIRRFAAAKDDMAVFIAPRNNNSGVAALSDGKEDMFVCGRFNGINCNFDVAVSAVLESDGA